MRAGRAAELAVVLILAVGVWLGLASAGPPRIKESPTTSDSTFSVARATIDLQAITRAPHSLGSPEHDRIRDYLIDRLRTLGFVDVHVQSATGFNELGGPIAATVANVVARKPGRKGKPAILLSAHYDAVPRSYGAGDDGAGVAATLEAVRTLANQAPLDHDLIVTFVDAEEEGLLGTEAFVNLHPWAKDVSVVLNVDARGNEGPVYMFQTSPGNMPLIKAIGRAVPDANTNSLTGEIYRHIPNDTDLSIWLHSGFSVGALNFAEIGGFTHYHTPIDNVASLDPRVMQHLGDYLVGSTRALDSADMTRLRTTDAIYFDAPFVGVIRYPASWAIPLSIDGAAIILVLFILGIRRKTLRARGLGVSALAMLLSLAVPTLITWGAWKALAQLHPGYAEVLQRDPYNASWYLIAFMAMTVAIVVAIQHRASTRASATEMGIVPALLWASLGITLAFVLPGGTYLFAWPVFAAATAHSWWRRAELRGGAPGWPLALLSLPLIVLWPHLIHALDVGLTSQMLFACALLTALVITLLTLPLQLAGELRTWIVRGAAFVAVVALIGAEVNSSFTETRKRPDSLSQLLDRDTGEGWWISYDQTSDAWTAPFAGIDGARLQFARYGMGSNLLIARSIAPAPGATPTRVTVKESHVTGNLRHVALHVSQGGRGEFITLSGDSGVDVRSMSINGRALKDGSNDRYQPEYHAMPNGTILRYFGVPAEGVELEFTVPASVKQLRLLTATEGFAITGRELPGTRPATMMSKPFVPTDMTLETWAIRLER